MTSVKMHDAKTQLSRLVARAEAGEEIVLLRGNIPVAKLVPIVPASPRRTSGRLKGLISVDDSFFEPLPEGDLDRWNGR